MSGERLKTFSGFGSITGQSPEMRRLYRNISKLALGRRPVLLLGESGTGKETVARAIHSHGLCPERPFVPVDCASEPMLIENELFGRPKPASAWVNKAGDRLLGVAGAIFLDEIGALSPELQAKLVRALQERDIRPTGGDEPMEARIIAASSRDLELAVQQGTFRRDLYFRLNVVSLRLPPLRDRRDDISLLAEHFLNRWSVENEARCSLSPAAMELLLNYDWPGNVGELKECVEKAADSRPGSVLDVHDLPAHIRSSETRSGAKTAGRGANILPLAEVERRAILNTLERLNGDKLMTARALGIGKTTLYRKLKEYGTVEPRMTRPIINR
jgi:DNA-binding NtrC family response regulator